jgi:hypothetical protein
MLSDDASRNERLGVTAYLGLVLLLSCHFGSPDFFGFFDELLHGATLWQVVAQHTLSFSNTGLPISPSYPGLEIMTAGTHWLTGLALPYSQLAVVAVARVMLFAGIFLVVERMTRSDRAGAIAVLAYCTCPQTFFYNAQFAYQTLAIALAVGVAYFLLVAIDQPGRFSRSSYFLALALLPALAITHHLTSWFACAALVLWAVALLAARRSREATAIGAAALVAIATAGAWTAVVGFDALSSYLGPIFSGTFDQLANILTGHQHSRTFFHDASGASTAPWEQVVSILTVAGWCAFLVVPAWGVLHKRFAFRARYLGALPVVIALAYPLTLLPRLASLDGSQISDRSATFAYFAMAAVAGGWAVAKRPRTGALVLLPLLVLGFVGGDILGDGPDWARTPGPYLVAANQRSISPQSIAAADWARDHLPAGSVIASDPIDDELMASIAHVSPLTTVSGGLDDAPLFYSRTVTAQDITLARSAHVRYLVVDLRLSRGAPHTPDLYLDTLSDAPKRLTSEELDKFSRARGMSLVYDNGAIDIYDLSALLGAPATAQPAAPAVRLVASTSEPALEILALLGASAWLAWAFRRRTSPELVLAIGAGASLVTMAAGVTLVYLHVSPPLLAYPVAVAALALGLWRWRRQGSPGRPVRPGHLAATCATVVLLGAAVALGVLAVRDSLYPSPAQLSVVRAPGAPPVLYVSLPAGVARTARLLDCPGPPPAAGAALTTTSCRTIGGAFSADRTTATVPVEPRPGRSAVIVSDGRALRAVSL